VAAIRIVISGAGPLITLANLGARDVLLTIKKNVRVAVIECGFRGASV
jgi:hypothetical protein